MAGFEQRIKERAKELKVFFKKGVKIVGESCKKESNHFWHGLGSDWQITRTICM
ncbi:hypothetical protein V6Z11_D02G211900 [Gossypium hirsutum]